MILDGEPLLHWYEDCDAMRCDGIGQGENPMQQV
jgi:hypothetical protein